MKVNEAKNYIEKAVVKIDEIQKRLNEIKTYESDYNYKKNCLVHKIKELGVEEYSMQKKILDNEYEFLDQMFVEKNFLNVELKNILNTLEKCMGCVFIDELEKQPLKAISKPIHYKVFQEAMEKAKTEAFKNLSNEKTRFSIYAYKYDTYSVMELYAYFNNYKTDYFFNHCIDRETNIFNLEKAKSEFEVFIIVDIEEMESLLKEGLKVIEDFNKKLLDLKTEKEKTMEKFKGIVFAA